MIENKLENKIENMMENKLENKIEYKLVNKIQNKLENQLKNKLENNQVYKSQKIDILYKVAVYLILLRMSAKPRKIVSLFISNF